MSLSVHIKKNMGGFCMKIDFEHEEGVLGILGASGCGKSLTLKSIAGIVTPDKGKIVLNGNVLFDSEKGINKKPQERNVGYLFQNYALFPNMTVEKNVLCGMKKIKDRTLRREKLDEVLTMMQIGEYKKSYPEQLSGGQQQRVALARILVSQPELLLLDEPFSALDSYLRVQLQIQLKDILEGFGRETILVSHSRDEIYHLCPRVVMMDRGKVLKAGNTKDIFANPGSPAGAILTGCKNIVKARKAGDYEIEIPDWGICLKTSAKIQDNLVGVGIRAHYFEPECRENVFPVSFVQELEEPFERILMFRYKKQKKDIPNVWWRVPKDKGQLRLPEFLGVAPENVLPLYPE